MSTSHRRPWVSVAAAVVTAALFSSVPGWGQLRPARNGADAPDAATDKDSPAGVTIPESPGASELLAKGMEKQKLQQWKNAADFYTDAVKQFSGRVVPNKDVKKSLVFSFTGISREVQERIAKWPAEGLESLRPHVRQDRGGPAGVGGSGGHRHRAGGFLGLLRHPGRQAGGDSAGRQLPRGR